MYLDGDEIHFEEWDAYNAFRVELDEDADKAIGQLREDLSLSPFHPYKLICDDFTRTLEGDHAKPTLQAPDPDISK